MTWATFYLVCFVVGFVFSMLLFFSGGMHFHLPMRWHFPHVGLHHGAAHLPVNAVSHGPGAAHGTGVPHASAGASPFNFLTFTAFLAWFGGTGYLLTRYSGVWFALTLVCSLLSGVAAAAIIFWFMAKLMASEKALDPADFEMVGVLGRITSSVREGGTGEMTYSQAGTRRVCGVRAEDGQALGRNAEVVVTRYEGGLAYVRPWEEIAPDFSAGATAAKPPDKSS